MPKKVIKKTKSPLFWDVKNPAKLSQAALVERVLNDGTWREVQVLIKKIGIKKVAKIFKAGIKAKRSNYRPQIANYFKLYFKEHA